MASPSPPDRRYDASVQIGFDGAADFLAHYLSTISKGSLFIPGSDNLHPLGTVLQINIELPVTQALVELGGVVAAEIDSDTQQGMLVHLLPNSEEAQASLDSCVRIIEGRARGRVIIIHEDRDFRSRVRKLLDDNGFGTITVASPQRALEILRPGGIDLALVTTTAEGMTGLEFAEHVGTLAIGLSVGVLLVAPSSKLDSSQRKRAKKLGVIGVMKSSAKDATIIKAVEGSFERPTRKPVKPTPPPELTPNEPVPEVDPTDVTGKHDLDRPDPDTAVTTPIDLTDAGEDLWQPEPLDRDTKTTNVSRPPVDELEAAAAAGIESSYERTTGNVLEDKPVELTNPAAGRPTSSRLVPDVIHEPEYPDVVTERHQLADLLERHMQQLGVSTRRTPDGRGVEGSLTLGRIKLVTPFGDGQPIPQVDVIGVGRDQVKCVGPAPMDELPPIEITPLETQEDLEKKIMGAFNRRLKAVYRVKGWLASLDVQTYLDSQRFCCFGKSEVGGHHVVFSAINNEDALIEEINGRKLNGVMPAQDRRFSLDGIRSRRDLDFRIDPYIAIAQQALLNHRPPGV